jgi:hypothetical protein
MIFCENNIYKRCRNSGLLLEREIELMSRVEHLLLIKYMQLADAKSIQTCINVNEKATRDSLVMVAEEVIVEDRTCSVTVGPEK